MHIHVCVYFANCLHCCCDHGVIDYFHGDLVYITLLWHQSPPVSVVSVSLHLHCCFRCLIRLSFSVQPSLSVSFFSHSTVAPHLVSGSTFDPPYTSSLSLCVKPSKLLSLSLPSSSLPCCCVYACVATPFVYMWLCVCVFFVLIQQRRKGKQRGSNLSVCTLSSPSHLSLFSFHSHTLLKCHVLPIFHSSCCAYIIFRARVSLEFIRMNIFGMTKMNASPAFKLILVSLATSLVQFMY